MTIQQLFSSIEKTMSARAEAAGFIKHAGDKGENREEILRDFLVTHLPNRYGVAKGEILTREGERSHAVDIIIYDAVNCPVLYSEKTKLIPVEGVYGIIEVKSVLNKADFLDAAKKIEQFKRLAPRRDVVLLRPEKYATLSRPSRPFGIVFGYGLKGNSLESLCKNWEGVNREVHYASLFANLTVVLGEGVLFFEKVNLSRGEKVPLLDTDEFVKLIRLAEKRNRNNEPMDEEVLVFETVDTAKEESFGRFFVYLLIMLNRIKLHPPDLGSYMDMDMPAMLIAE